MSGKIVERHVKRIKGQKPVFTGKQVSTLVTHQIRKLLFSLRLARGPEALWRFVEK